MGFTLGDMGDVLGQGLQYAQGLHLQQQQNVSATFQNLVQNGMNQDDAMRMAGHLHNYPTEQWASSLPHAPSDRYGWHQDYANTVNQGREKVADIRANAGKWKDFTDFYGTATTRGGMSPRDAVTAWRNVPGNEGWNVDPSQYSDEPVPMAGANESYLDARSKLLGQQGAMDAAHADYYGAQATNARDLPGSRRRSDLVRLDLGHLGAGYGAGSSAADSAAVIDTPPGQTPQMPAGSPDLSPNATNAARRTQMTADQARAALLETIRHNKAAEGLGQQNADSRALYDQELAALGQGGLDYRYWDSQNKRSNGGALSPAEMLHLRTMSPEGFLSGADQIRLKVATATIESQMKQLPGLRDDVAIRNAQAMADQLATKAEQARQRYLGEAGSSAGSSAGAAGFGATDFTGSSGQELHGALVPPHQVIPLPLTLPGTTPGALPPASVGYTMGGEVGGANPAPATRSPATHPGSGSADKSFQVTLRGPNHPPQLVTVPAHLFAGRSHDEILALLNLAQYARQSNDGILGHANSVVAQMHRAGFSALTPAEAQWLQGQFGLPRDSSVARPLPNASAPSTPRTPPGSAVGRHGPPSNITAIHR